jgi:hypothetical protein
MARRAESFQRRRLEIRPASRSLTRPVAERLASFAPVHTAATLHTPSFFQFAKILIAESSKYRLVA